MKIIGSSVILQDCQADIVSLKTDLPSPIQGDTQCLDLQFRSSIDTGVEYVRKHFGIEPEVISARKERIPFSNPPERVKDNVNVTRQSKTFEKIQQEWQETISSQSEHCGFFDGACPDGNKREPGRTRIGAVLLKRENGVNQILWTANADSGIGTVNTAEYSGLIALLESAIAHFVTDLVVCGDSQLVILQMQGFYRVKSPNLKELHRKATELASRINRVRFAWIPREDNVLADKLSKTI